MALEKLELRKQTHFLWADKMITLCTSGNNRLDLIIQCTIFCINNIYFYNFDNNFRCMHSQVWLRDLWLWDPLLATLQFSLMAHQPLHVGVFGPKPVLVLLLSPPGAWVCLTSQIPLSYGYSFPPRSPFSSLVWVCPPPPRFVQSQLVWTPHWFLSPAPIAPCRSSSLVFRIPGLCAHRRGSGPWPCVSLYLPPLGGAASSFLAQTALGDALWTPSPGAE